MGRLRRHLLLAGQGGPRAREPAGDVGDAEPRTSSTRSRSSTGVRFSHIWGGAIDTCSRFCVFWGTAMSGRVAYALGYTGLGVASTRFGAEVMLDLSTAGARVATSTDFVKDKPLPFPPEPFRFARHPGHTLVARPRGPHRQAQRLAAHARPLRPRLRQLIRALVRITAALRSRCRRDFAVMISALPYISLTGYHRRMDPIDAVNAIRRSVTSHDRRGRSRRQADRRRAHLSGARRRRLGRADEPRTPAPLVRPCQRRPPPRRSLRHRGQRQRDDHVVRAAASPGARRGSSTAT